MKYEEMSDLQINSAVLCVIDERVSMMEYNEETDEFFYCDAAGEGGGFFKAPDYCNNPSDAWPIILENKIGVMYNWNRVDLWSAISPKSGYDCDCNDKNPLRAAMICFLKMKDAEK
ncbi:NinX [Vibrio phage 1.042.O._10N.286.45.B8]|nr:NinX [Vibrio phage 1.042.O._10N.286.45.B8]